jgi:ABC-type phosphate transport system substrate-binding protein
MNKAEMKQNTSQTTEPAIAVDTVLANVDLKKVEEYLKTPEAQAELNRIANEPIKKWPKPTWEQLNTPMDI